MVDIMQPIPEFFKGRSIFITGATGFLGKVLMEKLLRSCADVASIYILVRPKKGHTPQNRTDTLLKLPLFDRLKQEHPDALAKIRAMEGDVSKLGLGLSDADRQTLEENVSIVFHVAASVRFDDPLRKSILMNTRSTCEIVELAKKMKQIRVLLHVSTTYCNTQETEVFEKVYPCSTDWRQIIDMAETVDDITLRILTDKVLNTHPNTYTFTKALAEQVIKDHRKELPVVIIRPSVVVSTSLEPIPGWIDNFNGPVGLMVAGGKGISHVSYCDNSCKLDYIPVDIVCKGLIVASWYQAHQRPEEQHEVAVYNAAASEIQRPTLADVMSIAYQLTRRDPFSNILYYPCGILISNHLCFYIMFILWHILPAVMVDTAMCIMGINFRLLRIQRRIFAANLALRHFSLSQWYFHNNKFITLQDHLMPEDIEAFKFGVDNFDLNMFIENAMVGGRLYLFKEDLNTLPGARQHLKRMKIVHYTLCTATVALAVWLLHQVLSSLGIVDTLSSWWTSVNHTQL